MVEIRQRKVQERPILYGGGVTFNNIAREKVCAYTRVSTDSEEQESSFELQCESYTKLIGSRADWEFAGLYADQGLSGTKAEHRPEFMRMIKDAKEGKINRILVKSMSRFARNTVDTLKYIRELKEIGVSIFFETQNIDTLTPGGEMLITILAATAEEESRTISKNIKWAMQNKFKEGIVHLNCSQMLGYKKGENGYEIIEEEANIIKRIYGEYLSGESLNRIAAGLMEDNIKTGCGNAKWSVSTVQGILTNEKYTGNAILGKTYKNDVLEKYRKKNEGQAPSYYVENSHPGIITQTMFDMVQEEKRLRIGLTNTKGEGRSKYTSKYSLGGLLFCKCGSKFRRYGRTTRDGEKIVTWVCVTHQNHHDKCEMLPLKEDDILNAYNETMKAIVGDLSQVKETLNNILNEVIKTDTSQVLKEIQQELEDSQSKVMELLKNKKSGGLSLQEYNQQYMELSKKIVTLRQMEEDQKSKDIMCQMEQVKLLDTLNILDNENIDFTDTWTMRTLVEHITVQDKNTLELVLKCGITKIIKL